MNQDFGAITMLIRMCEVQNITMQRQPPNTLDSLCLPTSHLGIPLFQKPALKASHTGVIGTLYGI